MSLQNRVSPCGELLTDDARGSWLGNRGILHNEKKEIICSWKHKNWVLCELSYKDRRREVFSRNSYSELFFLDEATGLAAGHRPCASCRRQRFNEFKQAWNAAQLSESKVDKIDKILHQDRAVRGGKKVTYTDMLSNLPDGVFIEQEGKPWLVWNFVSGDFGFAAFVLPGIFINSACMIIPICLEDKFVIQDHSNSVGILFPN